MIKASIGKTIRNICCISVIFAPILLLSGCYMKIERDSDIWKDYDYRNPVPPVPIPDTHLYHRDYESYYTPPHNYSDYYEQFYQDNDATYVPPSGYGCTSDNIGSFGCD